MECAWLGHMVRLYVALNTALDWVEAASSHATRHARSTFIYETVRM